MRPELTVESNPDRIVVVLQRAPNPLRDFLILPCVRETDGGALGEPAELGKLRLQIPFFLTLSPDLSPRPSHA